MQSVSASADDIYANVVTTYDALSGSKWKRSTFRYELNIICSLSLNSANFRYFPAWIVNKSYIRASLHHRNIGNTP